MGFAFPLVGATYRYYAKKLVSIVTRTPSAIILQLDFSNPKLPADMDFSNPKQPIQMNFPNANKRTNL